MSKIQFDNGGINKYINAYISAQMDLKNKNVLDCPAGDGRTSYVLQKQGADVVSADLFPSFFKLKTISCDEVDLSEGLPYPDSTFDMAVCQEGIEHMPNQLLVLQEFSRVLKMGGKLVLTAPNASQLRGRLSQFFCESEIYKRSAASELDSVWFSDDTKSKLYFGHVFLINVLKLRTLGVFSGLKIINQIKTDISPTSCFMLLFLYPFIVLFNLIPFVFYIRKLKHIDPELRKKVMWEQFKLNCSIKTLVCKHIMVEFIKQSDAEDTVKYLKSVTRGI